MTKIPIPGSLRTVKFNPATDIVRIAEHNLESGKYGTSKDAQLAGLTDEILRHSSSLQASLDKFVTVDSKLIQLKILVKLIYPRPEPVLITGPSGVGKEIIANAFTRPPYPFIAENCAGIPELLAESIFFGHKKGAFTGAYEDHVGLLEEASGEDGSGGIIFLDEIGDMPINLQSKFLRAIQEMTIRRVGEACTREISCRFIAATKYNLEELVEKGRFREDLYARLMTYPLNISPLSARPHDLEPILKSLLPNPEVDYPTLPPFTEKETAYINRYNVRALEALVAQWRITRGHYWI